MSRCTRFPNFRRYCRPFPTPRAEFQKLRWLGFSLTLHCSALFNRGQVTPFIVYIAAFGRFMRRSRIPKHSCRHIYSRCEVRSCGAGMRPRRRRRVGRGRSPSREAAARARAGARTLGVNMLPENAFKEMPTLANRWSNFRFSSGIQVYFWTQRVSLLPHIHRLLWYNTRQKEVL